MTNLQAIERLKCMRLFMQINDRNSTNKFLDEDYVANEMAVKALEKHIPKKMVKRQLEISLVRKIYHCPCCGKILYDCAFKNGELYHVSPKSRKSKFCEDCGQAIDWK